MNSFIQSWNESEKPAAGRRALLAGIGGFAAGSFFAAQPAQAGSLEPPDVPRSTAKPLHELEPRIAISEQNTPGDTDCVFTIAQRGSYYLTGNVLGVTKHYGIGIRADNVTIDLMGFSLEGASGSIHGVATPGGVRNNIAVRIGCVRNWGFSGIHLSTAGGGTGSMIQGIFATGNKDNGFYTNGYCLMKDCIATGNSSHGATIFSCRIENCWMCNNVGDGIHASNNCVIVGCNTSYNGENGIFAGAMCLLRDNLCWGNGTSGNGRGIVTTGIGNRILSNHCLENVCGIYVVSGKNLIAGNSCHGNTTSNYSIAAHNQYGPIIDLTALGAPAMVGNSAPSTLQTTDPWANFAY